MKELMKERKLFEKNVELFFVKSEAYSGTPEFPLLFRGYLEIRREITGMKKKRSNFKGSYL